MIDFRSDTLTRPSAAMLEAMMNAEVGDDVFGEDPTIQKLEKLAADLFGMDAAVFCPSGTMTNQIALRVLSNPFEEVICYEGAHIYKYEGGGAAGNSGLSMKLLEGDRGRINVKDIEKAINPDDPHFPKTALIALENTVNKGGGSYYTLDQIKDIHQLAKKHELGMHLDGARLMNALVETGDEPSFYGQYFDTISLCLSKGLGAPVGSVLICNKELEHKVRRARKVFGGGMRQAGYLAAAGIYALENNVERLKTDHERARSLGGFLLAQNWVHNVLPVDTNIVIVELADGKGVAETLSKLKENEILAVAFGDKHIRFVTHLDLDDTQLNRAMDILKNAKI